MVSATQGFRRCTSAIHAWHPLERFLATTLGFGKTNTLGLDSNAMRSAVGPSVVETLALVRPRASVYSAVTFPRIRGRMIGQKKSDEQNSQQAPEQNQCSRVSRFSFSRLAFGIDHERCSIQDETLDVKSKMKPWMATLSVSLGL